MSLFTKIPTDTYLNDYKNSQAKWAKVKQKPTPFKHQTGNSRRPMVSNTEDEYTILEYTKIGGSSRFCEYFEGPEANDTIAREKVYLEQCPYKNCRFTCDKSKAKAAHVLLFHETDLYREMSPNYLAKLQLSITDRAAQIWLLWNDEV